MATVHCKTVEVRSFLLYCPFSRNFEVTDDKLALLQRQAGTPISYLVNKPPVDLTVADHKYPLGSGLSHQAIHHNMVYIKHKEKKYTGHDNMHDG